MYMELPPAIKTRNGDSKDYILKLLANLYGQKQAGQVWNQYMVYKLRKIGFQQSFIDKCVFYRDNIIFIVYVDDGLFFGSDDDTLSLIIKKLRDSSLNIEDQGHPADYVGVNISKTRDGTYEFSQRALIDAIIDDVIIGDLYTKPVPAKVTLQLHAFQDSPKFQGNFNYRSAVGKLNYLSQTTQPDIMYAVHQVAKYSANPRQEHGEAIVHIAKYLKATRHIGFASSQTLPKASNVTATPILQVIGTRSSQRMTLALRNLGADGSSFMQPAPSFGPPSCSHKIRSP
eukprot:CCRYP_008019-RA/>CCRYP_008019-RA protein AED:0.18 eAED:0.18 QI:0/-1/0/1/-1/1/1/0/285